MILPTSLGPQGRYSLNNWCNSQHGYYWEQPVCDIAKEVLDLVSEVLCLSPDWATC